MIFVPLDASVARAESFKVQTLFSLVKVAHLVRGIFKPLRAFGAAGAAATNNGRRAKMVASFIRINSVNIPNLLF